MERSRTNYLRLLGTSQHALLQEAQNDAPGFTFVVRLMTIDFLKPAVLDDELDVVTLPQEVRGASITLLQECRRAEDILVTPRSAEARAMPFRSPQSPRPESNPALTRNHGRDRPIVMSRGQRRVLSCVSANDPHLVRTPDCLLLSVPAYSASWHIRTHGVGPTRNSSVPFSRPSNKSVDEAGERFRATSHS